MRRVALGGLQPHLAATTHPPALFQLEQLQGALYSTAAAEPEPRPLVDNFREPQELNQRLVLVSVPRGERWGGWEGSPVPSDSPCRPGGGVGVCEAAALSPGFSPAEPEGYSTGRARPGG